MKAALAKATLRRQMFEFMTEHRAASFATVSVDGIPHVATIYVVVKPDLTMYFSTRAQGRKYNNLTENPLVAMSFSDEEDMQTIQLTGMAFREENLNVEQEILYELIKLRYGEPNWPVPPVKLFENGAANELAIIKVVPNELLFANFESTNGRYTPYFTKIV